MSDSIDNRIVSMQFENEEFEKKAAQSTKTLDELEKKLDMSDSAKKTDDALVAIDKADFSTLVQSVSKLTERFSFFGEIGRDVLNNLTSSARNLMNSIVQTVDSMGMLSGMRAGWGKYNEYITSTQTIQSALPDMSIEDIEEKLDKLMWFTDETSYGFTDMVNSIGKFTGAGVGLEDSIRAMMGISNWAAMSGVTAREATRAFYNLSQAMGTGALKMLDWRSLELLNMTTTQFRQQAIDAAIALGRLEVDSAGKVWLRELNEIGEWVRTGKDPLSESVERMNTSMRETLASGWFDKDVMTKVFGDYGDYAEALYQFMKENDGIYETAAEAMEAFDYGGTDLAKRAFQAAQVARTFEDAIEAVKDAVATSWLRSWKYLFGNLTEASDLWTNVADQLWEVFVGGAADRNNLLKAWHEGVELLISEFPELEVEIKRVNDRFRERAFGDTMENATVTLSGYQLLSESLAHALNFLLEVVNGVKKAFGEIIPAPTAEQLVLFSYRVNKFMEYLDTNALEIIKRIRNVIVAIGSVLKAVFEPIFSEVFSVIGEVLRDVIRGISDFTGDLEVSEDTLDRFGKIGEGIAKIFRSVVTVLRSLIYIVSPIGQIFVALGDLILTVVSAIAEFAGGTAEATTESEAFSSTVEVLHAAISKASEVIVKVINKIKEGFEKVLPYIQPVVDKLVEFGKIVADWIKPYYNQFLEWLENLDIDWDKLKQTAIDAWPTISGAFEKAWEVIKKVWDFAQPYLSKIWSWVKSKFENVSFDNFTDKLDRLVDHWNTYILPALKAVWDFLKGVALGIWDELKETFGDMTFAEKLDAAEGVGKILLIIEAIKLLSEGEGMFGAIKRFFQRLSGVVSPIATISESFLQLGIGLLTMSLGLLFLTKLDVDKLKELPDWIGYLGGSLLLMVLVLNKIPNKRGGKTALTLIALAIAIGKIVKAVIDLAEVADGKNGVERIKTAGIIIDAMIGALGLAVFLTGLRKPSFGSLIAYYAMVGAIKLLVGIVISLANEIGDDGIDKMTRSALIVGGLIFVLGLMSGGISKIIGSIGGLISNIGKFVRNIGSGMLMLAASVIVIEIAIAGMVALQKKYSPEQIIDALGMIALLMGGMLVLLGLYSLVFGKAGSISWQSSVALIGMAAATWIIVQTMKPLIGIPFEDLISVAGTMALLMVALGGAVALMGTVKKMKIGAIIALIVVVIAMKSLTKAMIKFSQNDFDPKKVLYLCAGIFMVVLSVAALIAAMGSIKKLKLGAILALILSMALIAEVAAIIYVFDKYGSGDIKKTAVIVGALILVIDAAVIPLLLTLSKIKKVKLGSLVATIEAIALISTIAAAVALIAVASHGDYITMAVGMGGLAIVIDVAIIPLLKTLAKIEKVKAGSLVVTLEAIALIATIAAAVALISVASQGDYLTVAASMVGLTAVVRLGVVPLVQALAEVSDVKAGSLVVTLETIAIVASIAGAISLIALVTSDWGVVLAASAGLAGVLFLGVMPVLDTLGAISNVKAGSLVVTLEVIALIVSIAGAIALIGSVTADWGVILAAAGALVGVMDLGVIPLILVITSVSQSLATAASALLILIGVCATIVSVGWAISEVGKLPIEQIKAAAIAIGAITLCLDLLVAVAALAAMFTGGVGAAVTLAAVAAVVLSIGAAMIMAAEAANILLNALVVFVGHLPSMQASVNTFLILLIEGINAALMLIWQNIQTWALTLAHDLPFLGIAMIAAFLQGISDGIAYLGSVLDQILPGFGTWIAGVWTKITDFGKAIWDGIKGGITGALGETDWSSIWSTVTDSIKSFFGINSPARATYVLGGDIGQGLANGIEDSAPLGAAAAEDLSAEAQRAYQNSVRSGNSTVWNDNGANIPAEMLSGVMSGFPSFDAYLSQAGDNSLTTLFENLNNGEYAAGGTDIMSSILGGAEAGLPDLTSGFEGMGGDMMTSLFSGAEAGLPDLTAGFEGMGGNLLESFSASLGIGSTDGGMFGIGSSGIQDLISGFKSEDGNASSSLSTLASNGLQALRDTFGTVNRGEAFNIGLNLVQGIINGINNRKPVLVTTATNAMRDTVRGMSKEAIIASPSKVTTEIGEYLMIGLANGIENTTGEAVNSATQGTRETLDAMGKSLENLWSVTEFDDIDNEIHFTVVIDNQEALAQLNSMKTTGYSSILSGARFAAESIDLAKKATLNFSEVPKVDISDPKTSTGTDTEDKVVFNQYNYSPKSLSRLDIYRDTRKQLLEFQRSGR